MLLGPLEEALEASKTSVSSAGSCQVAVYSVTGIMAAKLVTKYGTRPVCITGAVLSSLGLLLSSFTSNLGSLIVTYSILTGIGFGKMLQ